MVGQVTGAVHLILYVRDQAAATAFWRAVLGRPNGDISAADVSWKFFRRFPE